MSKMSTFVISWAGMHDRAVSIAREIKEVSDVVEIVYSDPDPTFSIDSGIASIRRPNELFFGDKFAACVARSEHDLMLIIHADCEASDWKQVVARCREAYNSNQRIAVWAPLIQGSLFDIEAVKLGPLSNTPFWVVANTDSIVFSLNRRTVQRMRSARYDRNVYGWGISAMFSAFAFANKYFVVIDTSTQVSHPLTSGVSRAYSEPSAQAMKQEFLRQLDGWETVQHTLLTSHIGNNRRLRGRQPSLKRTV